MEKLKRHEAYDRAVAAFGEWRTWNRSEHIAYGLIRGVPYASMERYANDSPSMYSITLSLVRLGAWPEPQLEETPRSWWERLFGKKAADPTRTAYELVSKRIDEVQPLVKWVRKPVREKRVRPQRAEHVASAAEE